MFNQQNVVLTGKLNPATGQMEYEQTPYYVNIVESGNTVTYDVNYYPVQPGGFTSTSFPNYTTQLISAMYSVCAAVGCPEHSKPDNKLEANLDIFGSPMVQVYFCDEHYRLLAGNTDEHEIVPGIAIVGEGGSDEIVHLPQGSSVYPVDGE